MDLAKRNIQMGIAIAEILSKIRGLDMEPIIILMALHMSVSGKMIDVMVKANTSGLQVPHMMVCGKKISARANVSGYT